MTAQHALQQDNITTIPIIVQAYLAFIQSDEYSRYYHSRKNNNIPDSRSWAGLLTLNLIDTIRLKNPTRKITPRDLTCALDITASITIPAAYVMWGIYSQTVNPSTQSDKPPHEIVIRYMWNRAPQPHHTTEEATSDSSTKDTPTTPSKATALTVNSKQTRKIHPSAITEQHQLNRYTVTLFRDPCPPQHHSSHEDEASPERAVAPEQTQRPAIRIATYAEITTRGTLRRVEGIIPPIQFC